MTERLIKEKNGDLWMKDVKILEEEKIDSLSSKTLVVLESIVEEESYPKRIAEKLDIHEQRVYYHIKKLKDSGLIEVSREERRGGALCKFYRPVAGAFAFNIDREWSRSMRNDLSVESEVLDFFSEFIGSGTFRGSMVVGSPKEHGPFMTAARDGHYAVQLGLYLGGFCDSENRFVVKLDTEVKAEKALDRDLILVGGPITNTVSRDLNENLEVGFDWEKTWKITSDVTANTYSDENIGLVAKVHDGDHVRILLSGLDFEGTKTCILGVTQQPDKVLGGYKKGEDFYRVIRGLDRDGDGKTDDIEVLE